MILYSKWLALPLQTRHKIAEQFKIPRTGYTQVNSNVIVHDGFDVKDIENSLNLVDVQDYLNTEEENVDKLWEMLLNKIDGKEVEPEQAPELIVLPAGLAQALTRMPTDDGMPLFNPEHEKEVEKANKKKPGLVKGSKNKTKNA